MVRYWELERKTGLKKHSKSFFSVEQCYHMINILLEEVNLTLDDICEIWGTPGLEKNGRITHYNEENACPYHTLAHLYSGMLVNSRLHNKEKILAFGLDGGPDNLVDRHAREKKFYWGCYSDRGKKEFFPVSSPGAYWSFLRIRYKMEEGSLMALGSATGAYINDMEKYVMSAPDVTDAAEFTVAYNWIEQVSDNVERITRSEIIDYDERFSERENRLSIIVKIIQESSKNKLRNIVKKTIERYGINPADTILTMTGGFALNCPTNSYLMNLFGFKEFSTCPCVSDSGIALGIGLYELQEELGDYEFDLNNAFHGSEDTFVANVKIEAWGKYIRNIDEFKKDIFVEDLISGPIIWFDGQAEIGPRALGARSILGNPMSLKTKEELNEIKQRQWWRPVAPIIITGEEDNWFNNSFYSPYMLCTSSVRDEKKESVPAILHLDDSARIQSFSSNMNPVLYNGLCSFNNKTGVPIICNTSYLNI